ncbi:hypothetical protein U0070_014325, partial [Myodes glareolus]
MAQEAPVVPMAALALESSANNLLTKDLDTACAMSEVSQLLQVLPIFCSLFVKRSWHQLRCSTASLDCFLKATSKIFSDTGNLGTVHYGIQRLKLTIQKEVVNDAILQQMFVMNYILQFQIHADCHRTEAMAFWKFLIQKTSEMNSHRQHSCHTHFGHLLSSGDLVLGFELTNCDLNDELVNNLTSK